MRGASWDTKDGKSKEKSKGIVSKSKGRGEGKDFEKLEYHD
jgi:hypothetical protein